MNVKRQIDMDRDADMVQLLCRNYCKGLSTAEESKKALMACDYGSVMAERLINEWAEYLQRPLPFPVSYIRGSAL